MLIYTLKRLAEALPTLLVVILLAFLLTRAAPGGPFDEEQAMPPEVRANLERSYGLDAPLHEQFLRYLGGLLRGDFGPSFTFKDYSVSELIAEGLPTSAALGGAALLLAVLAGIPLGLVAALRARGWLDRLAMGLAVGGIALPVFVIGPLLVLVFGVYLDLVPVAGWGEGAWLDRILPTVTLALPIVAYLARLTRGSVLEVLQSPFVMAAKARGVARHSLILRHVLPAAMVPVIGYLGPASAAILTGSLVVEILFGIPGIGRHLVMGALNRDYTLVMGMVILYASSMILANLVADLGCAAVDPRIRLGRRR
ncbi:MAG: ABC transporter permease [Steroidobacteraceae bacterium]